MSENGVPRADHPGPGHPGPGHSGAGRVGADDEGVRRPDRGSRTLLTAAAIRRLDPAHPDDDADAVIVEGDRIVWIGRRDRAPGTERHDELDGWLAPGFVDAHVHATATGLADEAVDLAGAVSLADALARLRRHAARTDHDVVIGSGWDETTWPEQRPPRADEVAAAAPGRTVLLNRIDSHSCVVDAATLARLQPRADEFGAHLVRDDDGRPTGWLKESAGEAARTDVSVRMPETRLARARERACRRALELGVTSFHEMAHPGLSGRADAQAWLAGRWPVDVHVWWADIDPTRRPAGARPGGDLFLDGSLGSSTAAVAGGYLDGSGSGQLFHDDHAVVAFFVAATQAGEGAAVHAIGDRAVTQAVRAVAAAAQVCGDDAVRAARHRVEHTELIGPPEIATMARLGIVASVQPAFDAAWGGTGGLYARRLGAERALRTNPFASLAAAGVPMAFGSDSTVTPMGPWRGVAAAQEHRGGLGVDRVTAWTAHVHGGHFAAGQDDVGAVAVGARADLTVWDADPLHADLRTMQCGAAYTRGVARFRR